MAILSNLYPPIVNDINPAFIRTATCKVYFAFSSYNSTEDIKNIQVSVINQRTNLSALDPIKYPTGIKIVSGWSTDDNVPNEDYKYYININIDDLASQYFELNQTYKVQLRFTSTGASNPPIIDGRSTATATWLANNIDYFSEWSSVCLIRGISRPIITIRGLQQNSSVKLNTPLVNVVGNLRFTDQETEYLKSYNIKLLQGSAVLTESGDIYTNSYNPNEFNY